jgi:signal transduction histidine kinase
MKINKIIKKFDEFDWAAIKLSVFYVVIAMFISVLFSFTIYRASTFELGRGLGKTFGIFDQVSPDRMPPEFENFESMRMEQIKQIESQLKSKLIYINLAILLISSSLSYFLAKKTLMPLKVAMDSQNRFTADASHELRTPLTAMRAEIEVALRNGKTTIGEARKLLRSNIEEIIKLETLSDALLKLARYQRGVEEMKIVDIQATIVEAFERVQPLADRRSIEFKNNLKNLKVLGDKQSLVELFVIILDNAIKYSGKGKKIEINVSATGGGVKTEIKDNGIGIKASDLNHIFERFYRADISRLKDTTEPCNGYGLGLALAKEIVDAHSGNISVVSSPGKGTRFTVFLKS